MPDNSSVCTKESQRIHATEQPLIRSVNWLARLATLSKFGFIQQHGTLSAQCPSPDANQFEQLPARPKTVVAGKILLYPHAVEQCRKEEYQEKYGALLNCICSDLIECLSSRIPYSPLGGSRSTALLRPSRLDIVMYGKGTGCHSNKTRPSGSSHSTSQQIEQLILRGILRPGERLPSERELSEKLAAHVLSCAKQLRICKRRGC